MEAMKGEHNVKIWIGTCHETVIVATSGSVAGRHIVTTRVELSRRECIHRSNTV